MQVITNPKRLILVLTILAVTGCRQMNHMLWGDSKSPNHEIVIVVAGQSNGTSPTDNVNPHTAPFVSSTGKVYLTHNFITDVFSHEVPTTNHPAVYSASWVHLGDLIAGATGRTVHIINVSHGARTSVSYYKNFGSELNLAVATYQPDFVIWVQGEADFWGGITQTQSYDAITAMINETKVKWFVALDSYGIDYQDSLTLAARLTQKRLIAEGKVQAGVDVDLLRSTHPDYFEPAPTGYDAGAEFAYTNGLQKHGEAWFYLLDSARAI